MPHIHTEPGQHDITVSAWIVLEKDGEHRVLVHMHRKMGKLMQVGGHIELDETPWQTIAHELTEESGFELSDLSVLQPLPDIPVVSGATVHPLPALANTHMVGSTHYHSDFGFAFLTDKTPDYLPAEGESQDLRWLTIDELQAEANSGKALQDVADIYRTIVEAVLPTYHRIAATAYSLDKPSVSLLQSK